MALSVPAGTIMLTQIKGPLGVAVGFGQLLLNDGSRFSHAGIVDGEGNVIEAHPLGCRVVPLAMYQDGRPLGFCWPIRLNIGQREAIVAAARADVGKVKYGWLDFPALALVQLGLKPKALLEYVERPSRSICSQSVDRWYLAAGVHLFDDGRASGQVSPGDLANLVLEKNWAGDLPADGTAS